MQQNISYMDTLLYTGKYLQLTVFPSTRDFNVSEFWSWMGGCPWKKSFTVYH